MSEQRPAVLILDGVRAADGAVAVDIEVQQGEVVRLPGGLWYGALLHVVLGLRAPFQGAVTLLEQPLADLERGELLALRARCGVAPDKAALIANLSVFDNIALPLRYHLDLPEDKVRYQVEQALGQWGLSELADERPHELDEHLRGEVALVRCLVMEPELVVVELADERLGVEQCKGLESLIAELARREAGVLVIGAG